MQVKIDRESKLTIGKLMYNYYSELCLILSGNSVDIADWFFQNCSFGLSLKKKENSFNHLYES